MSIYAKAHVQAFTKDNIHAAFRKTGVIPFNPDVVTDAMMAPSLETSTSSILALRFTSPVQTMIDLISHHQARKRKREDDIHELEGQQCTPPCTPTTTTPSTPTMTSLDTYTHVRIQLQTQEEKKDGGKRKGCINMDGKAKILTQDDIFKAVVEGQTAPDAAKDALLKRKDAEERYSDAVGVWKVREMDRREKNTLDKEGWKTEVKKWEVERDSAKYDKRKPRWQKPKMLPMEKATIKPKLSDFVEVDDDVNEEDKNSDLDGSDSD